MPLVDCSSLRPVVAQAEFRPATTMADSLLAVLDCSRLRWGPASSRRRPPPPGVVPPAPAVKLAVNDCTYILPDTGRPGTCATGHAGLFQIRHGMHEAQAVHRNGGSERQRATATAAQSNTVEGGQGSAGQWARGRTMVTLWASATHRAARQASTTSIPRFAIVQGLRVRQAAGQGLAHRAGHSDGLNTCQDTKARPPPDAVSGCRQTQPQSRQAIRSGAQATSQPEPTQSDIPAQAHSRQGAALGAGAGAAGGACVQACSLLLGVSCWRSCELSGQFESL